VEAEPERIVDADAVLAQSIAAELSHPADGTGHHVEPARQCPIGQAGFAHGGRNGGEGAMGTIDLVDAEALRAWVPSC
jgi:hypothetical protein